MSITVETRQFVWQRAKGCCEYCLLNLDDTSSKFQLDHIIARKYEGSDDIDNLCVSCVPCNRHKGAVVAALDTLTEQPTRLFNPRIEEWNEHFIYEDDGLIFGISPEGRVTTMVLRFNLPARAQARKSLYEIGDYPCT